ncbi:MAG: hypothetical protein RLY16_2235 [Bacteroidota bacterium]|jgi:hypothetical protein
MHCNVILLIISFLCISCHGQNDSTQPQLSPIPDSIEISVVSAIPIPQNFHRIQTDSNSFGNWLQHLHLRKNTTVFLFNGLQKPNQSAQYAVIDIPIGTKNLMQCADVIMKLRAQYLFEKQLFSKIEFFDNNGKAYQFGSPFTQTHLDQFLEIVFGACGTASLSKQLHYKNIQEALPGDVLIRGGFPGHAVLIIDKAINEKGDAIYLLLQGYMPAQDMHILKNPNNLSLSPWYQFKTTHSIYTPEYVFKTNELKTW